MNLEQSWRRMANNEGWSRFHWLAPLLWPASMIYAQIAWSRRWLYRKGIYKSVRVSVPVVSVGNLTVGGSGKTPFAMYLSHSFKRMGYHPGILIRGYRRKSETEIILSPNTFDPTQIEQYGDEASLIVKTTHLPVGIGSNRITTAQKMIDELGCNVLILDDGFQHLPIHRDIDLLLLDSNNPFGNGYTLPFGSLRESKSTLQYGTAIVWNGGKIENRIGTLPNYHGHYQWQTLISFSEWMQNHNSQSISVNLFPNTTIQLLSGIGNPIRLEQQAENYGFQIAQHHCFADHHWYRPQEILEVQQKNPDMPILLTEKDAIRILPIHNQLSGMLSNLYVIQGQWIMNEEENFLCWIEDQLKNDRC